MIAIIEIPDHYKNIPQDYYNLPNAVRKGKILPNNATNGDVIKAMFPVVSCVERNGVIETDIDDGTLFSLEWWNASYTKEQTE